jgi:hypothetical protein
MSRHGKDALSLTEARRRIAALARLDLTDKSIEHLKILLSPVLNWLPTRLLEYPIGAHFWRGVRWETWPTRVSQLSYPPADKVTRHGRANRAGEPRFYCSLGGHAPFFELQLCAGQHVALSKWRARRKIIANHVGYTPGNFARMGSGRVSAPWGEFETTPMMRLAHDFLAEQFSKRIEEHNEHEYKLSVAIAELMMPRSNHGDIHALAYPAMATRANHDNVVLWPEAVETHLALERAIYFRVRHHDVAKTSYHADELAIAESFDGGEIHWVDPPPRPVG